MAGLVTATTANANTQAAYASKALPHKQYLGPNFTLVSDPAKKASFEELHSYLAFLEKLVGDAEKPLLKRTEILLKVLYPQPKQENAPVQATAARVDQKAVATVRKKSSECRQEAGRLQVELSFILMVLEFNHIISNYKNSLDAMKIQEAMATISSPLFSLERRKKTVTESASDIRADSFGYYVVRLNKEKLTSIEAIAFVCRWSKMIDPSTMTIDIKGMDREDIEEIRRYYDHPVEEIRVIARVIISSKNFEQLKNVHCNWTAKFLHSTAKLGIVAKDAMPLFSSMKNATLTKIIELAAIAKSNANEDAVNEILRLAILLLQDHQELLNQYKSRYLALHQLRDQFSDQRQFFAFDKPIMEPLVSGIFKAAHPKPGDKLYPLIPIMRPQALSAFIAMLKSEDGRALLRNHDPEGVHASKAAADKSPSSPTDDSVSATTVDDSKEDGEAFSFSSPSMADDMTREPLDDGKETASASLTAKAKEPVPDEKEGHGVVSVKKTVTLESIIQQIKLTAKTLTFAPRIYDQADWMHDFPVVACFIDSPYALQIFQLNDKTGKMDTRYKFFGQVVIRGKTHRGVFEVTKGGLDGKIIHHFFTPKPTEEFMNEVLRKSWDKVDYPSLEESAKMTAGAKPIEFTVPDFDKAKFSLDPYFQSIHFEHGEFAITLVLPQKS